MDAGALSLAALEGHDPHGGRGGRNRRFRCPLPACDGSKNRNLSVNRDTGAWECHKCGSTGLLVDFRAAPQPRFTPRSRKSRTAEALARLSGAAPKPDMRAWPAMKPTPQPEAAKGSKPLYDFEKELRKVIALADTPAAGYLASRGLPDDICAAAGVRYSPDLFGRRVVVFPLRDGSGAVAGIQGRIVAGEDEFGDRDGTKRTLNNPAQNGGGVFATPGAWETETPCITEAPIDALTLAACGVPSIATVGTSCPAWIGERVAFRTVYLAHDADDAGEKAAQRIGDELRPHGCRPVRLAPPSGSKDWNDALQRFGPEALTAALGEALGTHSGNTWDAIENAPETPAPPAGVDPADPSPRFNETATEDSPASPAGVVPDSHHPHNGNVTLQDAVMSPHGGLTEGSGNFPGAGKMVFDGDPYTLVHPAEVLAGSPEDAEDVYLGDVFADPGENPPTAPSDGQEPADPPQNATETILGAKNGQLRKWRALSERLYLAVKAVKGHPGRVRAIGMIAAFDEAMDRGERAADQWRRKNGKALMSAMTPFLSAPNLAAATTTEADAPEGMMVYTADMGTVSLPSPRPVFIAGKIRPGMVYLTPEMVDLYARCDRPECKPGYVPSEPLAGQTAA